MKEGDKFYKVSADLSGQVFEALLDLKEIKKKRVMANELLNVYTESKTFIANGILTSSETREDMNHLWHDSAKKIYKLNNGDKML